MTDKEKFEAWWDKVTGGKGRNPVSTNAHRFKSNSKTAFLAALAIGREEGRKENVKRIEYDYAENGDILLTDGTPFDGHPVLIKLANGWCEAWWAKSESHMTIDGPEFTGYEWVCCDDTFTAELDDATHWMPLPVMPECFEKGEGDV